MNKKKHIFPLVITLLLSVGTFSFVPQQHLKPHAWLAMQEQQSLALKQLEEFKTSIIASEKRDDLSNIPDPAFHGWWQMVTRGSLNGFGFGAQTTDIDSYIFIDLSQFNAETNPFVTIQTLCGTPTLPRQPTFADVGNGIKFNIYYVPHPQQLVNIFDLNGPAFDPKLGQSFWSLQLQEDRKTLCASIDSQPFYQGNLTVSGLFRKVEAPPPIRPYDDTNSDFPSVNDPVEIAKYIYNARLLNHNQAQNVHLRDKDYRPFYKRELIFKRLLSKGLTFETKIRKIRVSQPGPHYFFDDPTPHFEILTDIFTDEFSYAVAGSTVEIKGFKGKWAAMNGTYINGVPLLEEGAIPNPSPRHLDVSSRKDHKKGTFRNVYNHFLLRFNSLDPVQFPRDELGYATEVEGNPTVKVTHHITSDMEYPAFFAAIRAMYFAMYRVSTHDGQGGYYGPPSIFLIDTWNELKERVRTGNFGIFAANARLNQNIPTGFYNNAVLIDRFVTLYNDPFGLSQVAGSISDYNIVLTNYIVLPKNLYWAIAGTPTARTQFDPVTIGYKPLIPGPQPAHFTSQLGPLDVVNGRPVPHNPDPTHYTLYGDPNLDEITNSNGFYIGLIDPRLTGEKKVGYLRWLNAAGGDPKSYITTSLFAPQVPPNIHYSLEAYSKVLSPFTYYLQTELNCDAVILDIRSSGEGSRKSGIENDAALSALASFFGDDRVLYGKQRWTKKPINLVLHPKAFPWNEDQSKLLNLAKHKKYVFFNDVEFIDFHSLRKLFVRQNERNYGPGVVFKGAKHHPKKVIILTDCAAWGVEDIFPHAFLGERLDGHLGSYTTGKIIGNIDGRWKGAAGYLNPVPVSLTNNFLYDSEGHPMSLIYYIADFAVGGQTSGTTNIFLNRQSNLVAPSFAPSLRGTAGGPSLPMDWENTVWPDIGLIPPPKGHFSDCITRPLPTFNHQASWRDSWLEQAILEAIQ